MLYTNKIDILCLAFIIWISTERFKNYMKKLLIIVLTIIIVFLLFKFGVVSWIEERLDETQETNQTEETSSISEYEGPVLPEKDFSNMKLFEDGFEIVTVKNFADGDTALFVVNGEVYKTRFLAIDSPEKDPEKREIEPWGETASDFTKNKLKQSKEIILELDPDSDIFDKYDRLLAWVWVDGELLNYLIVEEGLAEVAYLFGDYLYTDYLEDIQYDAEMQGIKIWGETDPDFEY